MTHFTYCGHGQSRHSEEQQRRGAWKKRSREGSEEERREGGSRRSTLDEACFVVGPAFVPRAGANAAASGGDWIQFTFVSPSGRLCVVVCVPNAHVCVCLEKLRKKLLVPHLEISVANLKLKYDEG